MRKKISDQSIFIHNDEEAETTKEIMERKGISDTRAFYKFLDQLEEQGLKVVNCRVMRKYRDGTWHPKSAYYIQEGETN